MELPKGKIFLAWCRARRTVFLLLALVFASFFIVYNLYRYPWGVAGYAALVALAAVGVAAVADFAAFAEKHVRLSNIAGRFPTAPLPPSATLLEEDYTEIITALEAQRAALEADGEHVKRDAEEYYTLWAHQIKTPMAAMRLLLQSSGEKLAGKEKEDVAQELFRIGQYVDMVLQYQRLSSLTNDLVLQSFPLEMLAKQAAKNCATLFIRKNIPFEIEKVNGVVVTDEKWFVFVLEQLYTNAIKYTRSGKIKVYSKDETTLVVEDTGIGVPPEDLPRVFERGFTGAAGRSERSSTGIGLYLCRRILGRLGFGITLESAPGKGTKAILHLAQTALDME